MSQGMQQVQDERDKERESPQSLRGKNLSFNLIKLVLDF